MSVREQIRRLWQLSVPATALISYLTAAIFTFLAFTVGGIAFLLASPPMAVVYLVVFGSAFVAAFSRSRYLPRISGVEFAAPIFCSLVFVLAAGWAGIVGRSFGWGLLATSIESPRT